MEVLCPPNSEEIRENFQNYSIFVLLEFIALKELF